MFGSKCIFKYVLHCLQVQEYCLILFILSYHHFIQLIISFLVLLILQFMLQFLKLIVVLIFVFFIVLLLISSFFIMLVFFFIPLSFSIIDLLYICQNFSYNYLQYFIMLSFDWQKNLCFFSGSQIVYQRIRLCYPFAG